MEKKRIGLAAGVGLGAAAAVALRRRWAGDGDAAGTTAKPPPKGDPDSAGEVYLAHLAEAIRIATVSYEDDSRIDWDRFAEFREFLAKTYPLAHDRLDHELFADRSLLFTWKGTDPDRKPIVLMAHQDVVPVEPGTEDAWEAPPFAGDEDEWYLYGRGSLDDKGSLIGILEAVESLLADGHEPEASIHLAFGHDEEVGGTGAEAIAAELADRGVRCSLVLDEGGAVAVDFLPGIDVPVALIGIGEKGYVNVRLTAAGQGGHSSAPPQHTAIGALSSAIAALEANPMPPRLEAQKGLFTVLGDLMQGPQAMALKRPELFGAVIERRMSQRPTTNALIRTTTAATIVSGGVKPNVLPQEATAIVNFRIIPGDTVESVLEHVRDVVGPEIEVSVDESRFSTEPAPMADPESDQFEMIAGLAREHCGAEAVAPWILTGAVSAGRFYLPDAEEMKRESIITSVLDGKPEACVRVPGPSFMPMIAAVLTGLVFIFATFHWWILTGATDSRHFIPIADQVLRFVPLTASADDFKRFHGTGERIRRSDADGVVAFYRALIETAGGPA